MGLPVPQAHPTKVMFAIVTLHVIASAVFLDTNVALWTVFGMCTYVIRSFAIVCAFCQPLLDYRALGRCVIIHSASTKRRKNHADLRRILRVRLKYSSPANARLASPIKKYSLEAERSFAVGADCPLCFNFITMYNNGAIGPRTEA